MKNTKYKSFIGLLVLALLFACAPYEDTNPDLGLVPPPDASQMDFSITPGDDAYHFNIEITSPTIDGISAVSFDLGNGSVAKGRKVTAYYPLPGDYTIKMTITTNSGSTSITKDYTTTETDYSIFTDPLYVALTGGINNTEGKSWVVDSLAAGHFGIGPAGGTWPEWWSATSLQKTGSGAYDDEFVFIMDGFKFEFNNNGDDYVKDFRGNLPFYSNAVALYGETDLKVNYTPGPATWTIDSRDDGDYIVFSSETPMFFGFDYGAVNDEYRIESISENYLSVSCIGGDGNRWYNKLIVKGYVPPQIELEANLTETSEINTYDVSIDVTNLPVGESIDSLKVDFGNGYVYRTDDVNEVVSNTYMRKGTYMITATISTSLGDIVKTLTAVVAENHPDYVAFQLDQVVMYNDFSEVEMAPVLGQDCSVEIMDNPDRTYPNKSAKVAFYSKTNQQWANAYMELPSGYRFDLRLKHTFSVKVYGKAGDQVLLKLENTDRGGNAWQTGTYDLIYTIQNDNTWEIATFDFSGIGAGWDWTGDIYTSDVVTDDNFNHDFYNVVRIMLNPGVGEGTHEFYFDELSGPHVEGLKSAEIR